MTDRISELVQQKQAEYASQEALAAVDCQIKMQLEREREARLAEVRRLAQEFYAWAKRNRLQGGIPGADNFQYYRGWVLAHFKYNDYSGNFITLDADYALVMTTAGKLWAMEVERRFLYLRRDAAFKYFNPRMVEEGIAEIVVRSGRSWP